LSKTGKNEFCYTGNVEYIIKRFAAYGHPLLSAFHIFQPKQAGKTLTKAAPKCVLEIDV